MAKAMGHRHPRQTEMAIIQAEMTMKWGYRVYYPPGRLTKCCEYTVRDRAGIWNGKNRRLLDCKQYCLHNATSTSNVDGREHGGYGDLKQSGGMQQPAGITLNTIYDTSIK